VTDFHFESPETSEGIIQLDIESKVGPSIEKEELKNDYIEYNVVSPDEGDYIDYTGL
jgi:hypothetical protein